MSGSRLQILALVLPTLAACAHVDADREVLGSVQVEGNRTFEDDALEEHLALVPTPVWPWADRRYFDQGTLAGDRRRLERYYQAQGFYDAKVQAHVESSGGEDRVTFVVDEGLPTLVRTVDITGLESLPAEVRARIRPDDLPLRVGQRLAEVDYDTARLLLAMRLREEGYARAAVTGKVEVEPKDHAADVHLRVDPGSLLDVGTVVVSGTVQVPRSSVMERVKPLLAEGQRWRESALTDVRQSLQEMGVFGAVSVQRGEPVGNRVPVVVALTESPMRTLRAGFGADFQPLREETHLRADYENRNFLGGLRLLRLESSLGYAFVCSPTESKGLLCFRDSTYNGVVGSTAVDLTQPDLMTRLIDGNLRLEYTHDVDPYYRSGDFLRARLGFPVHVSRTLTFVPSYNIERDFFRQVPINVGDHLASCDPGQPCATTLSRIEQRLEWDLRNDLLQTTHGFYGLLRLQEGGGVLGGDYDFVGAGVDLRSYHPLPLHMVLALRAQAGVLVPGKAATGKVELTPPTQRFFAGGANSIRSYGFHGLSPMVVSAGTAVPEGGNQLLAGSAELRFPVIGPLGAVAFSDVASVQKNPWDLPQPNLALGGGLRYRTPFGPVRLDAAVRVAGKPPSVSGSVPIDTGRFALQFSVGEAF